MQVYLKESLVHESISTGNRDINRYFTMSSLYKASPEAKNPDAHRSRAFDYYAESLPRAFNS
ncbi:hypothetical protein CEV33_3426 [Brucella grignonensis]|uniref:Uncharacterized protein n=1 Tax=Brucella grignonensis TaxID=94627 RepID=A0A256F0G6_9HYPH|nr:hypothetical protein CEV33_3426 [Brucella grignonensis]